MTKILKRLFWEESGQSALIMAVAIVALLGITAFTVDVGFMFSEKRLVQNTADAAALAGARELIDGDNVYEKVRDYVLANGLNEDDIVNAADIQNLDPENDTHVPVILTVSRDLFFARALGFSSLNIAARAVAAYGPTAAMGLKPFGVYEDVIPEVGGNFPLYMEFSAGGGGSGNWGLVNFDGPGSSVPQTANWLENGYQGPRSIEIGSLIWAAPGVNLNAAPYNHLVNTGDEWYIPILKEGVGGTDQVEIIGFAKVVIVSLTGGGSHMQLQATYYDIDELVFAGGTPVGNPGSGPDSGIQFSGVTLVD